MTPTRGYEGELVFGCLVKSQMQMKRDSSLSESKFILKRGGGRPLTTSFFAGTSNMEGPDGGTSNVKNFGTSNSNAENRIVALNKMKLTIKAIRAFSPLTLLAPATKDIVKSSLNIIKNLLSDQGDEIATLLKGLGDAIDELFNALAEIKSKSHKEIVELFYGDKITSLRESLNKTQASITAEETAQTNVEESLNTCQANRLQEKEEQLKKDSRDESECQKLRFAMLESRIEKISSDVDNMLRLFS